jgi:hypothetical protein
MEASAMNRSILLFASAAILAAAVPSIARADSVELVNGDLLHGRVVSLDDEELHLMSEIHGAVIIARDKIAAIGFGERNLARPAAEAPRVGRTSPVAAPRVIPSRDGNTVTATVPVAPAPGQDVVRQLRAQGLTAQNIAELQKAIPMLRDSGARQYFDNTVQGLSEGSINVDDVRKEAIRAREEYRKSAKSLGPDGEKALNQALGGYLQILDRFIDETDPKAPQTKPAATPGTKTQNAAPDTKPAHQPAGENNASPTRSDDTQDRNPPPNGKNDPAK